MARSICPLLNNHKQGYICQGLNSAFIYEEDVENICRNPEAFTYCIHYSKRNQITRGSPNSIKGTICPKCNSLQLIETLYFLSRETQTPNEFKAYICEACGYTELFRSR